MALPAGTQKGLVHCHTERTLTTATQKGFCTCHTERALSAGTQNGPSPLPYWHMLDNYFTVEVKSIY